jgi:probable F420-dependent oxidoreductase
VKFVSGFVWIDPRHYVPLAQSAEASGWDGVVLSDHLVHLERIETPYPYAEDGQRPWQAADAYPDVWVSIGAMAAVTERLRFTTFVVKLPIRLPVIVAKSATSVAVLTGNRFAFGVGLSPWPEDFQVTGQDWKSRGKRMDEMIEIIRGLATGEFFEYHGDHYDIDSIKICPVPTEPLPILIGGHAEPALRRAARLGDGWMHAGGDQGVLEGLLSRLSELRKQYGRDREPFEIHVISMDAYTVDGVRRLEDLGVTDVIVGFRNAYEVDTQTLQHKIDALRQFADNVIAKV